MSQTPAGRQSNINRGSVVIKRTAPNNSYSSSSVRMSGGNVSARSSMTPGTYKALSDTGVVDMKGKRQMEKRDLQDLNERFANYIDKVHFLEANCKRLEAENEALRNRKEADLEPIRKAYENELGQARQVIDDLTSTKGNTEAKMAGLQDELDGLRDLIKTYENQSKDYKKKIDSMSNQIGEYEGELHTLRLRVGSLEDENAKIRELLKKVQEQNRNLRADLDAETAAHLEADGIAQTKGEEAEFYKDLVEMFELLKPEPVQIKGMDQGEFWKSEMQKALREINIAYDDKIDTMQMEMDAKYSAQINALRNGNVKDGMGLQRSKDETSRLKSQLAERNAAFAEMQSKLATMTAERDDLLRQLAEMQRDLEQQTLRYNTDVGDLQDELASVLAQFQTLMDAKMSLELEIACYKKLLEGEEHRVGLKSIVEDALGTTNKGSAQNALEAALMKQQQGGADQSTLNESTGSLTVQRSSKGPIAFKAMDHSGANITIENTSSGARARNQNLKNWRLVKSANGRNVVDITLKDYELSSGKIFTLWARGGKEKASDDNEQVGDNFSFGVGSCIWKLLDEQNAEKATLTARFTT